jgi:hypothetical protein
MLQQVAYIVSNELQTVKYLWQRFKSCWAAHNNVLCPGPFKYRTIMYSKGLSAATADTNIRSGGSDNKAGNLRNVAVEKQ